MSLADMFGKRYRGLAQKSRPLDGADPVTPRLILPQFAGQIATLMNAAADCVLQPL